MADADALAEMPSMRPPPGLVSDFVNPYSLEKWIVLCAVMCLATATLFVAIRTYTKFIITKTLDWADCELPRCPDGEKVIADSQ